MHVTGDIVFEKLLYPDNNESDRLQTIPDDSLIHSYSKIVYFSQSETIE